MFVCSILQPTSQPQQRSVCKHFCNKELLSKYTCASPSSALISRCVVFILAGCFDPSWKWLKFNLLQKHPKHQRHRLAGLSFPYRETPRAQGGDLLEKQYIYEGICADHGINTNIGKLLSHHKPYYDNMFLITVFGVPVIWILCYELGFLIVACFMFIIITGLESRCGTNF